MGNHDRAAGLVRRRVRNRTNPGTAQENTVLRHWYWLARQPPGPPEAAALAYGYSHGWLDGRIPLG